MTYRLVANDRSHIRFLPEQGPMADRTENAIPGTVVDTDITTPEPNLFDFYLQSRMYFLNQESQY